MDFQKATLLLNEKITSGSYTLIVKKEASPIIMCLLVFALL
jgi:hypothetical protein